MINNTLGRKPEWLRIKLPSGENYVKVRQTVASLGLHTVCEEAKCPNIGECWGGGTATIMIMGDICTRGCRFCSVAGGRPLYLDPNEPERVAQAIKKWGLSYVVITSVCRDDLQDGGANHIAKTLKAVKVQCPKTIIEPLIPDFHGNRDAIEEVAQAGPEVISHNIETVARLSPLIRDPRATYEQSLRVLKIIKEIDYKIYTKSSIMLGLGETEEEVMLTAKDLRSSGVDILSIGQYLQPTSRHVSVKEYIVPEKFDSYRKSIEKMGFAYVVAGPFIRSSYKAGELFIKNMVHRRRQQQHSSSSSISSTSNPKKD
ncbi:MAG TPA: lipoyl synthase [Nitrososphaera sp.]|nr:lipoyl synthase [Nitrososphaera sp.]